MSWWDAAFALSLVVIVLLVAMNIVLYLALRRAWARNDDYAQIFDNIITERPHP